MSKKIYVICTHHFVLSVFICIIDSPFCPLYNFLCLAVFLLNKISNRKHIQFDGSLFLFLEELVD